MNSAAGRKTRVDDRLSRSIRSITEHEYAAVPPFRWERPQFFGCYGSGNTLTFTTGLKAVDSSINVGKRECSTYRGIVPKRFACIAIARICNSCTRRDHAQYFFTQGRRRHFISTCNIHILRCLHPDSPSQSRGRRKSRYNFSSAEPRSGCQLYSQRTCGGNDIRIDSVRPADCSPNSVPRS